MWQNIKNMILAMIFFTRNFALIDAFTTPSAIRAATIKTELCALTLESPAASDSKRDSNSSNNLPNRKRKRPTFEDRMRTLVQPRRSRPTKQQTRSNDKMPANLQIVNTLEEYKVAVGDEKERLVVVRFFAPWCKVS